VSTAGTLSNRSRGKRPSSFNVIGLDPGRITVETHIWDARTKGYVDGPTRTFDR